jgi:predicted nucleic acid-binding protein
VAAVPDTNVWVSALKFGGKPIEIVQMALDGQIVLCIAQSIID